jgi:hypothetical protein
VNFKEAVDRVLRREPINAVLEDLTSVLSARPAKGVWSSEYKLKMYSFRVLGSDYKLKFSDAGDGDWYVWFCRIDPEIADVHDRCTFKRLEAGVGVPVFHEVLVGVRDFLAKHKGKVEHLRFSGADPGLTEFYEKFVPFLIRSIGRGYSIRRIDDEFIVEVPSSSIESVLEDLAGVTGRELKGRWDTSEPKVVSYLFSVVGEDYELHFKRHGPDDWRVGFCRIDPEIAADTGEWACTTTRVKTGIGMPVFKEVAAATLKFLNDHKGKVAKLGFSGADKGLEQFYKKFVPFLVSRLGPEYKFREEYGDFYIVPPKKSVEPYGLASV